MGYLERRCWLAWARVWPAGGQHIIDLATRYGSAQKAWRAGREALQLPGPKGRAPGAAVDRWRATDPDAEAELLARAGVGYLTWADTAYPEYLRHIFNPPAVLYYLGDIRPDDDPAVALVGSRRSTYYGREMAGRLAKELAGAGLTVVSGMARGIDTAAHRGALEGEGRTFAVLGSGLDVVYPPENRKLMREIAAHGAVISEFPLGSPPEPWHFPVRNRIISGLTRGTVVVEAAARSGALITAELALEQGRDVMAVPGNVTTPVSRGPHGLIKQGARLVESGADILEEIGVAALSGPPAAGGGAAAPLDPDEERVLKLIEAEPLAMDIIIRDAGLPSERVTAVLTLLEIKGIARRLPGGLFHKILK